MNNAICVCSTSDLYGPFIEEWLNEPVLNSDKFVIVDVTKDLMGYEDPVNGSFLFPNTP